MNTSTSTTLRDRPPLVSIGMPVYNGARFLREALDSILAQTFTDFEVILSDNASTDETMRIAREYAARDPRVRLYENDRNMGATYNYNRVFALARGRYFRHAAHDDVIAPTNVERCVAVLEANSAVALAYPRMQRIDEGGHVIDSFANSLDVRGSDPVRRYKRYHALCNDGSMCDPVFGLFRSDVLARTPILGRYMSADMVLLGEIALLGEIHEIPEYLFFERWHPGTSVNANPSLDDRAAWFDPALRGKWSNRFPHWRWLLEYARSILRVPLTPLERGRCLSVLLGAMWRYKRPLVISSVAAGAFALRLPRVAGRVSKYYWGRA